MKTLSDIIDAMTNEALDRCVAEVVDGWNSYDEEEEGYYEKNQRFSTDLNAFGRVKSYLKEQHLNFFHTFLSGRDGFDVSDKHEDDFYFMTEGWCSGDQPSEEEAGCKALLKWAVADGRLTEERILEIGKEMNDGNV